MEKLTLEECKALYFDENALNEPPYKLFRIDNHSGGRFYYREIDGEIKFYMSVTNMISSTMPTSPGLINWIADMGREEADKYAYERSVYGTFMHEQFTKLLLNRSLDMDFMAENLKLFMEAEKVNSSLFSDWYKELKKDILSFASFAHTHKIKPLAIEVVLCDDEDETAGAIDLLCKMQVLEEGYHGEVYKTSRKGFYEKDDPKLSKEWVEITAIVDYKSGKKGFYEEHEIQLAEYKKFTEKTFGVTVDKTFNFSPKDWKSQPSFHLKDQTDSINQKKLPYLIEIAKIEKEKRMVQILNIDGTVDLDAITEEKGLEQFYSKVELGQHIKNQNEQADRPD